MDSALFDLRSLVADAEKSRPSRRRIEDVKPGSGLIDVRQLLEAEDEDKARPKALPIATATPGSLLAEIRARNTAPPPIRAAAVNRTQTRFLVACILALLCTTVLLASKALA